MRKFLFPCFALMAAITLNAQKCETPTEKKHHRFMQELTAAQIANLKTKRMTLHLDLTPDQVTKIYQIELDHATHRKSEQETKAKAGKPELSAEERYNRQVAIMDQRIAHQAQLKSILDDKQYQAWKKSRQHFRKRGRKTDENKS